MFSKSPHLVKRVLEYVKKMKKCELIIFQAIFKKQLKTVEKNHLRMALRVALFIFCF